MLILCILFWKILHLIEKNIFYSASDTYSGISQKNINNIIQKGTKRIALTTAIMYAQVPEDSARKMVIYLS